MATKIIMCEAPNRGQKRTEMIGMLGPASPKANSYLKISFKDDDNALCTVEYEGRITVPTQEALEWLGMTDKKETGKQ